MQGDYERVKSFKRKCTNHEEHEQRKKHNQLQRCKKVYNFSSKISKQTMSKNILTVLLVRQKCTNKTFHFTQKSNQLHFLNILGKEKAFTSVTSRIFAFTKILSQKIKAKPEQRSKSKSLARQSPAKENEGKREEKSKSVIIVDSCRHRCIHFVGGGR